MMVGTWASVSPDGEVTAGATISVPTAPRPVDGS